MAAANRTGDPASQRRTAYFYPTTYWMPYFKEFEIFVKIILRPCNFIDSKTIF
jgi:hypothetical protein